MENTGKGTLEGRHEKPSQDDSKRLLPHHPKMDTESPAKQAAKVSANQETINLNQQTMTVCTINDSLSEYALHKTYEDKPVNRARRETGVRYDDHPHKQANLTGPNEQASFTTTSQHHSGRKASSTDTNERAASKKPSTHRAK